MKKQRKILLGLVLALSSIEESQNLILASKGKKDSTDKKKVGIATSSTVIEPKKTVNVDMNCSEEELNSNFVKMLTEKTELRDDAKVSLGNFKIMDQAKVTNDVGRIGFSMKGCVGEDGFNKKDEGLNDIIKFLLSLREIGEFYGQEISQLSVEMKGENINDHKSKETFINKYLENKKITKKHVAAKIEKEMKKNNLNYVIDKCVDKDGVVNGDIGELAQIIKQGLPTKIIAFIKKVKGKYEINLLDKIGNEAAKTEMNKETTITSIKNEINAMIREFEKDKSRIFRSVDLTKKIESNFSQFIESYEKMKERFENKDKFPKEKRGEIFSKVKNIIKSIDQEKEKVRQKIDTELWDFEAIALEEKLKEIKTQKLDATSGTGESDITQDELNQKADKIYNRIDEIENMQWWNELSDDKKEKNKGLRDLIKEIKTENPKAVVPQVVDPARKPAGRSSVIVESTGGDLAAGLAAGLAANPARKSAGRSSVIVKSTGGDLAADIASKSASKSKIGGEDKQSEKATEKTVSVKKVAGSIETRTKFQTGLEEEINKVDVAVLDNFTENDKTVEEVRKGLNVKNDEGVERESIKEQDKQRERLITFINTIKDKAKEGKKIANDSGKKAKLGEIVKSIENWLKEGKFNYVLEAMEENEKEREAFAKDILTGNTNEIIKKIGECWVKEKDKLSNRLYVDVEGLGINKDKYLGGTTGEWDKIIKDEVLEKKASYDGINLYTNLYEMLKNTKDIAEELEKSVRGAAFIGDEQKAKEAKEDEYINEMNRELREKMINEIKDDKLNKNKIEELIQNIIKIKLEDQMKEEVNEYKGTYDEAFKINDKNEKTMDKVELENESKRLKDRFTQINNDILTRNMIANRITVKQKIITGLKDSKRIGESSRLESEVKKLINERKQVDDKITNERKEITRKLELLNTQLDGSKGPGGDSVQKKQPGSQNRLANMGLQDNRLTSGAGDRNLNNGGDITSINQNQTNQTSLIKNKPGLDSKSQQQSDEESGEGEQTKRDDNDGIGSLEGRGVDGTETGQTIITGKNLGNAQANQLNASQQITKHEVTVPVDEKQARLAEEAAEARLLQLQQLETEAKARLQQLEQELQRLAEEAAAAKEKLLQLQQEQTKPNEGADAKLQQQENRQMIAQQLQSPQKSAATPAPSAAAVSSSASSSSGATGAKDSKGKKGKKMGKKPKKGAKKASKKRGSKKTKRIKKGKKTSK